MPDLSNPQKLFIVQRIAMFQHPSAIREAVKEEFGIDVPREQIRNYNPEQVRVAKKWKKIHDATRRTFLKRVASIPISHQAVRLYELNEALHEARRMRNYVLLAQLLEQAAKEMGGMFTNRQKLEHSGPDGKPLPPTTFNVKLVRPSASDG